jgi:hypothetical protein
MGFSARAHRNHYTLAHVESWILAFPSQGRVRQAVDECIGLSSKADVTVPMSNRQEGSEH